MNRNFNKRIYPNSNSSSIDEREFLSCSDCSVKPNKQAFKCDNFKCTDQSCFSESSRDKSFYSSSPNSQSSDDLSDSSFKDNKLQEDRQLLAETIEKVVKNGFSKIEESKGNSEKKKLPTVKNNKVSIIILFYLFIIYTY